MQSVFFHLHLPITADEIKRAEPLRPGEGIENVVNSRQWVRIFPCDVVDLTVVNAKACRTILLD